MNHHFTLIVLAKVLSPLSVSVGEDVRTGSLALIGGVTRPHLSGEWFGEPRENGGAPGTQCSVSRCFSQGTVQNETCMQMFLAAGLFSFPSGEWKGNGVYVFMKYYIVVKMNEADMLVSTLSQKHNDE